MEDLADGATANDEICSFSSTLAWTASACCSFIFSFLLTGLRSPLYTLFLPLLIEPYTDGRSWARKPGHDAHLGLRDAEVLTSEDEEED